MNRITQTEFKAIKWFTKKIEKSKVDRMELNLNRIPLIVIRVD